MILNQIKHIDADSPFIGRYVAIINITTQAAHMARQAAHITTQAAHMARQAAHITTQAAHMARQAAHITTQAAHITIQAAHITIQVADMARQAAVRTYYPFSINKVKAIGRLFCEYLFHFDSFWWIAVIVTAKGQRSRAESKANAVYLYTLLAILMVTLNSSMINDSSWCQQEPDSCAKRGVQLLMPHLRQVTAKRC
jgi:hypothetical protein